MPVGPRLVGSVVTVGVLALGAPDASAQAWKKRREECASASEDGQLAKVKGQLRAARDKLLLCAEKTCPGPIRKDCEAGLAELERLTPSIVFGAKDRAGKDLVDVKVFFDGKLLVERLDGKAVEVDPGEHTLRFEAADLPPHEEKVLVREGEKARVVVATLAKKEPPPQPRPRETGRRLTPTTLVLGGVGAAALAGAGAVGLIALGKRSSLYDRCGKTGTCSTEEVDSVYRLYNVSYVLAGVGGALLATSAVLYLTSSTSEREQRASVHLVAWPGGASLSGRF